MSQHKEPFHYRRPPSLDACVRAYEADLTSPAVTRVPVERVFVLGAGFSRAFGFTTSATIVKGVMEFFQNYRPSYWHTLQYDRVSEWLDLHHANWTAVSPDLTTFLKGFFPEEFCRQSGMSDPLRAHADGLSWERGNYPFELPGPHYEYYWLSFEALLCDYLFSGLDLSDVLVGWARNVFNKVTNNDVFLTFNWDVITEVLLTMEGKPFSRYEWARDFTKVAKLHGSVDLLGAPNERMAADLKANTNRFECITPALWRAVTSEEWLPRTKPWPFGRVVHPWESYNKSGVLIMPPSYTFGYGYDLIQFNWRKARTALERGREVFIIGYSLAGNDEAFQGLLRAAAESWSPQTRVTVWNPDPEVAERARELCGSKRVEFHPLSASDFRL